MKLASGLMFSPDCHSPEGFCIPLSAPVLSAAIWKHSHLSARWLNSGLPKRCFMEMTSRWLMKPDGTILFLPAQGQDNSHSRWLNGDFLRNTPSWLNWQHRVLDTVVGGKQSRGWFFPLQGLEEHKAYRMPHFTLAGLLAMSSFCQVFEFWRSLGLNENDFWKPMECSVSWSVQKSACSGLIWRHKIYFCINVDSLFYTKAVSLT